MIGRRLLGLLLGLSTESVMEDKCCRKCKFYESRTKFCRARPPVPLVLDSGNTKDFVVSKYPGVVFPDTDWCGEFKPGNGPELLEENRSRSDD